MTQRSRFWDGLITGDANAVAPYDADVEFAEVLQSLAGADATANGGIVCAGVLNELACTSAGVGGPINVATGRAIVDGSWYENDAVTALAVTTPVATNYGYVYLYKDNTAQTVRVLAIQQAVTYPALTQTHGTEWMFPIYSYTIDSGGNITLKDMRVFTRHDFQLLGRVTLAGDDDLVSFDISGLPAFHVYMLVTHLRADSVAWDWGWCDIYFNAGSAGNYDVGNLDQHTNMTLDNYDMDIAVDAVAALATASEKGGAVAGRYGSTIAFLFNLRDSAKYKNIVSLSVQTNTAGALSTTVIAGTCRVTTVVDLINLSSAAGVCNFVAGSQFSLYGIM